MLFKTIKILNIAAAALTGLISIASLILFLLHLFDGSPSSSGTLNELGASFLIFTVLFVLIIKLGKNQSFDDFTKSDYLLEIVMVAGLLISLRIIIIFLNPVSYSSGGRQIDLPLKNYWAYASGGTSVKFFGGFREEMNLTVFHGHEPYWKFCAEIYPKSISWRGSSIIYDEDDYTVTFEHGRYGNSSFESIMFKTPGILEVDQINEFKGRSEKISKSPNGKYEASAQSDADKMELIVRNSKRNILWQCKMTKCSSVIDWQYCDIVWEDKLVIYDCKLSDKTYLNDFFLRTPILLDPDNFESFQY